MLKRLFRPRNISLLIINLIPLYGVFKLGWDAMSVILLYVVETLLIGIVHVFKMTALYVLNRNNPRALSVKRETTGVKGAGLIPFFIIHFGFFVAIQMVIFFGFAGRHYSWSSFGMIFEGDYRYLLSTLVIAKLSVLMAELFWDPEVETKLPDDVFFEPYPRIVVQQFMVILGGFFSIVLPSATAYLIILVVVKTLADVFVANVSLKTIERWNERYKANNRSGNEA